MTNGNTASNPLWFKDAVIYEVHIKSFADSNGDGIGDIQGLTQHLDYIEDLGVTAIWLLPFYPSPLRDDGYDIADYFKIHRDYGTLNDFKKLLREAHRRGIRIITELVLNHTSDQHAWFQRARKAAPGSKDRDFYVWSDSREKYPEARIIFKDFETSNWTWDSVAQAFYWHRFYSHQPDLNYDNPQVVKEMFKVIDFWFGMGVDGMRLDAVPYIYEREGTNCENLPETYELLKELRAYIDSRYTDKILLAEANQWPEDAARYFGEGDACHMNFHFPLMPRMFMSVHLEDRYPIIDILEQTPEIPENCQWAVFLRNHDELTLEMVTDEERDYMYRMYARDPKARINLGIRRRLAPLLQNDRKRIELLNVLLMSMPGSPVVYYGDELGMGDNYYLGDRDGVRTPMQWSADRNGGFSRANPQRLYLPVIIDPEYHYEAVNVETQQHNPSSLLWWMKSFIAMRKRHESFGRGTIEFLLPDNPKILTYVRRHGDEAILVVCNLSRFPQSVLLELPQFSGYVPEEVFSRNQFPTIRKGPYPLTLNSYGYLLFSLSPEPEIARVEATAPPGLCVGHGDGRFLDNTAKESLQTDALPAYLRRRGWFGGRGKRLRSATILEALPVGVPSHPSWLIILEATYLDGPGDTFNLLLSYAFGDRAERIADELPQNVVCHLPENAQGEKGLIFEGIAGEGFCGKLLELASRKQRIKGRHGEIVASPSRHGRRLRELCRREVTPTRLLTHPANTIIVYAREAVFKVFRRAGEGMNPDLDIVRRLTDEGNFEHTPRYLGSLQYRKDSGEVVVIGVLKEYVHSESNAWDLCMDAVRRFQDRAIAEGLVEQKTPKMPRSPIEVALAVPSPLEDQLFNESDRALLDLLGRRTAELHKALSLDTDDPAFHPEPFSQLSQRSAYQDVQSKLKRSLQILASNGAGVLPEAAWELARPIVENRRKLLDSLKIFRDTRARSQKIRVHGDFHLKHLLFTGRDFSIIDFEGKASKTLSERRIKKPPLTDVADLTRSIHYAAYAALHNASSVRPGDVEALAPWVELWRIHASGTFLRAYLEETRGTDFVPADPKALEAMFNAFLMEKLALELQQCITTGKGAPIIPIRAIRSLVEIEGERR